MNSSPLHPMLAHMPMALAVVIPPLAGALLFAWWRGFWPRKTWLVVVGLTLLLFGSSLAAMRTGEGDEEAVERIVPEAAIEEHEEAAEAFTWAAGVVLALSLLPFALKRRPARLAGLATVGGSLVLLLLGYRVGSAGGDLVWRHGAAAAFSSLTPGMGAAPSPTRSHGREHDDDD